MIPSVNEIKTQILKMLQEGMISSLSEFRDPLAKYFNLSDEELNAEYDSANGNIFNSRIRWAFMGLSNDGIIERSKRGVYKLPDQGQSANDSAAIVSCCNESPADDLFNSFKQLKEQLYSDILKIINKKTPKEFEKLAVKLLQAMGYGDGYVTQYNRDNGIDAVIKEDVLGLGHIYIQTKRFENGTIGRPKIQEFIGALQRHGLKSKGVFITTSRFSKDAIECAKDNGVVLIDGNQLAKYIYDFGLGMQLESTLHIKKIDHDFWDMMEDE